MKNTLLSTFIFLSLSSHAQIITTIAGIDSQGYNGDNILATDARLDGPFSIAFDHKGNLYIADGYSNRIRKVDTAGIITTFAGNGVGSYNGDNIPADSAELYHPVGITFDRVGNLYFTDAWNERVRKIDTAGIITTIAGTGTYGYNGDNIPADSAKLYQPWGIAVDANNNIYISDAENHRIRKVDTAGIITTIAGTGIAGYTGDNGLALVAEINGPYGIVLDDTGNIYFADASENVVRKIDTLGIITNIAGTGVAGFTGDNGPADTAQLKSSGGIAIDNAGNIYIADIDNQRIRKVTVATGIITTIVGNGVNAYGGNGGPAMAAEISDPTGVAFDVSGNLYIADFGNNLIRRIGWPEGLINILASSQSILVYPNPSKNLFTVEVLSPIIEQIQIMVTNQLGQIVKEASAYTNTPLTIYLDQFSGIYLLTAITSNGIQSKTITMIK